MHAPPLLSYVEMTLPLPEPRDLWRAPSAAHWKRVYLSKYHSSDRMPSILEIIHNWSLFPSHTHRIDVQFSALLVLHAFWVLIWEHRQLASTSRMGSCNWSALILSSRHQELCQSLQHFRMTSSDWGMEPAPEVMMLLESLSMHLHMSLEELQLFAGKEDKEEARRVYVSARQWIDSQSSRQAVWHAGQVVRAARNFHANHLRDFYAIELYHASVAFWSYGIVSRVKDVEDASSSKDAGRFGNKSPSLWLDGEETAEVHKFVTWQKGVPGLMGANQEGVLLEDTGAVSDLVREVLRRNFSEDLPPPLVENLSQLMRDLGEAARAVGQ
jgi:hypothetical protein